VYSVFTARDDDISFETKTKHLRNTVCLLREITIYAFETKTKHLRNTVCFTSRGFQVFKFSYFYPSGPWKI